MPPGAQQACQPQQPRRLQQSSRPSRASAGGLTAPARGGAAFRGWRPGGGTPTKQARLPPITPVQQGGASGSAQGPAPPLPAPQRELDLAEEAAATDREVVEDSVFASILQTAYFAMADAEEAARQAARVPVQPATEEPAGGSLWTYL